MSLRISGSAGDAPGYADPVHYHPESPFGPYWPITRFDDIVAVESQHEVFSSEPTIAIGDPPPEGGIENFIQMDPPRHDEQRKVVQPVVAPRNPMRLEPIIRELPVRVHHHRQRARALGAPGTGEHLARHEV